MGEITLPAGASGEQSLSVVVRGANGEKWEAETEIQLPGAPATTPRIPMQFKWAVPTGGFIGISSPRTSGNSVFVGVDDQGDLKSCGVSAFSLNGKLLWHFATDSGIKNNVAVSDGRVYATSVAGWLYALSADSGKLVWKEPLDRPRERWEVAATTVADGLVHVGAYSYVATFDARDGRRVWGKFHGTSDWWPSCYTIPTVIEGKLLLATRTDASALDARTGQQLWKVEGKFNGCVVAGDIIYVNMNGRLCALALADGKPIWTGKNEVGDTASAPALVKDKLLIGTADGRVCAFSTKDGVLLWSAQTGPSLTSLQPYKRGFSDVNSSPAVLGDVVYVGASDGQIHALALENGAEFGNYDLGVPIASSPFISGETLYIGGYDGNLYAFAVGK
jgi:outer membrane protein assembly factor BamB